MVTFSCSNGQVDCSSNETQFFEFHGMNRLLERVERGGGQMEFVVDERLMMIGL